MPKWIYDGFLQPEALAAQLLDVIASKIGLRENIYFGLAYFDSL